MKRIFFAIGILALSVTGVLAQGDEAELTCTMDDLDTVLAMYDLNHFGLELSREANRADLVYDQLLRLRKVALFADMFCSPLAFSSVEHGLIAAIGPVDFEDGVYRVTVLTDAAFIGKLTVLDGDCDDRLFNLSRGQANDGAQAIMESESCTAIITTDNAREPWLLTFEKIN